MWRDCEVKQCQGPGLEFAAISFIPEEVGCFPNFAHGSLGFGFRVDIWGLGIGSPVLGYRMQSLGVGRTS